MPRSAYWNHNVHYQPVILNAVPPGCHTALDVGCGDGLLAARLAERCAKVTGIDRDPQMIATARARNPSGVTFIEADFLTHRFPEESFDFVCANTSLHHMDFTAALTAMARLLRPGGQLAVIGLAADKSLADLLAAAPALPVDLFYRAIYRRGESGAPIMDPDHSWREVRAAAATHCPASATAATCCGATPCSGANRLEPDRTTNATPMEHRCRHSSTDGTSVSFGPAPRTGPGAWQKPD